jgi:hypothetical protein
LQEYFTIKCNLTAIRQMALFRPSLNLNIKLRYGRIIIAESLQGAHV